MAIIVVYASVVGDEDYAPPRQDTNGMLLGTFRGLLA